MSDTRSPGSRYWVILPMVLFALLRLPMLVHAPGGQDEQWFAVPGWTVWNEGIPRIPYVPTRQRENFFENADRCLMALPPALFYLQAPFHACFDPGYATSRLPLFFGALVVIGLTFGLSRTLGASIVASLLAALLMAVGRPLMFTSLMVRPDLFTALFGWISLLLLWKYDQARQTRYLVTSGLACGVAGLFHPFALLFAIQVAVAILCMKSSLLEKLKQYVLFASGCLAALLLWLPLIVKFPDEFRSQFFSNVLERAGPGLPTRMLWPWPYLKHHATLLYEFAGPYQCGLYGLSLVVSTIACWKRYPRRQAIALIAVLWSSIYLTAVMAGQHPTKGYWLYPCLWLMVGLALAMDSAVSWIHCRKRQMVYSAAAAIVGMGLMLPGAGLRSTWIYLRHWGDSRYHGRHFIASVLAELPQEGLFLADLGYVYDVYLSGRETLLCQERDRFWKDRPINYRAILLTQEGADNGWASQYDAVHHQRFGHRRIDQECFVDLYVPKE